MIRHICTASCSLLILDFIFYYRHLEKQASTPSHLKWCTLLRPLWWIWGQISLIINVLMKVRMHVVNVSVVSRDQLTIIGHPGKQARIIRRPNLNTVRRQAKKTSFKKIWIAAHKYAKWIGWNSSHRLSGQNVDQLAQVSRSTSLRSAKPK